MGYCTNYTLRAEWVDPAKPSFTLGPEFLNSLGLYDSEPGEEIWDADGDSNDAWKWYRHEKELANVSRQHPGIVFILDGKGEEQGDVWRKFFLEGTMWEWRPESQEPPTWGPEIQRKLK